MTIIDCGTCHQGVIHNGSLSGNPLDTCPDCFGLGLVAVHSAEAVTR